MKFTLPLLKGTLIKRYRRFLVDVRLNNDTVVTAHCPNSGKMIGCCEPGRPVILSDSQDSSRRHPLTWEMIDMETSLVCINPLLCRKLMYEAIEKKKIPSLSFFHDIEREAEYGLKAKIDVMLHGMEKNGFVNLYNVTWAEDDIAYFPDAVNPKAERSLNQLGDIAKQGHHAAAFFFVQRQDCSMLKPAEKVDRNLMKALLGAHNAGVEIIVYRASVSPQGISIGTPIPYSLQ